MAVPAAVRAALRIRCADAESAQRLRRALAVDDPEQTDLRVSGRDLVLDASSTTALGLLRTLDDVLACLRAAEPEL